MGGACRAGAPVQCSNAATCVEDPSALACTYPGPSAWLVYEADEDTPAVDELYAVKESVFGVQQPIKISGSLPNAPVEHFTPLSFVWSPDARWLLFGTTEKSDTVSTRYYAVRFDRGIPEAPIALTSGLPPVDSMSWSPTEHELLFQGTDGSLYWIHLSDDGVDVPVQLNAPSHVVRYAIWATRRAVVYSTTDSAAYRVSVGSRPAPAPSQFTSNDGPSTLDLGWASADGAWLIFHTADRVWLIANVASLQVQRLAKNALDPSQVSWQFSPDCLHLVYAASEQVIGLTELYLVDLRSSFLPRTKVESTELMRPGDLLGSWAPDSSFFTYFGDPRGREEGQKSLNVYDMANQESSGTGYDVGFDDWAVGFSPDRTSILYSTRFSPTTSYTELTGIDRKGDEQSFDEDAAGRPYSHAEFATNGLAALYCTTVGTDQLTDMVFADLRPPLSRRSVRVPGEGSVYSCSKGFAPDSKGFAYYRFAPDGARTLYWVDITKQVMSQPLPLTRAGRVSRYDWQPGTTRAD
ncbi:MAG: hypothetical protein WDO69_15175 [Pseudomonadota bacterium]